MDTEQDYLQLISVNRFNEALSLLDTLIDRTPDDDKLLFERGKLRWRLGDRSGATGDYAKAVAINPDSPASTALQQAQDIAQFFNPDMYNP